MYTAKIKTILKQIASQKKGMIVCHRHTTIGYGQNAQTKNIYQQSIKISFTPFTKSQCHHALISDMPPDPSTSPTTPQTQFDTHQQLHTLLAHTHLCLCITEILKLALDVRSTQQPLALPTDNH